MALVLGLDAKMYRNSAVWATPSWVEFTNVKDVTLSLETAEADVTTRASGGWRAVVATLKEGSVESNILWDTADANFEAVKDAFFDNTSVEFAVMDGDITVEGTEGLRADFSVVNFTRNEPLEDALNVDFTIKPTASTNAPVWYVVPAP